MGNGSKKLLWAGAAAAFLLALLLALAVIVPRVVDSAWLKETIRTEVAKQIKGDFDFQKAELALLPVPAVSLTQVRLAIPNTAQINLETLKVYPKFLPLLIGSIEIKKIVIDEPVFSLSLPQKQEQKKEQRKSFSFSETLDAVSAKLSSILSAIPGLEIGVHKGTLRLFAGAEQVFLFENINGSFAVSNKSLTATIICDSNIWESMELQGTLTPGTGAGKGSISLKNLNAKALSDHFLQEKPLHLENSFSSLKAEFTVNPETGFNADFQSSGSSFTALQENKKITAQIENFKGSIQYSDQVSAITVGDITLSQPRVQFSGSFKFDRFIPLASLDINVKDADITGIRDVLPPFVNALYGDLPALQDIFAIIRGGAVLQASIHVDGKSPADLAIFESMLIQGHAEKTAITLPDLGLDLQGVTGDVTIAQGVLEGRNLQAELGNTKGSGGTLKLGLVQGETIPFHLALDLNADLSEIPPLLKKLVPEKQVLEYLSLLENLAGTGQGRLTMGETLDSFTVQAEMDKINLLANFTPIPFPIIVNGGRILYDGLQTQTFDLQGKIGKSTFYNYSSHMDLAGEPAIEVNSGTFHLVLDEIFPWLARDKRIANDQKDITDLTGLAEVTVKSIKGPLLQPANLAYDLQCGLQNIILTAALLPGPLTIKSGQADIVPDKITFENLQAILLDSSLTYSGVLQNFISGKTSANVIVTDANIAQELNSWFAQEIKTPKEYIFRTPLLISRADIKWIREELLDVQGDFSITNGPIFSVDIMLNPDELVLRNLSLKNDNERANIQFDLKRQEIGAEFQGALSKKTIDKILLHNDAFPNAWIKGDIRFHILMDSLAKSVATGSLDGGDFIFPWELDNPLLLHSFSLSAADKTLTLNSAEAVFEGRKYAMQGQASLIPEHLSIDLNVRTDTVELDKIISAMKNDAKGEETKEKKAGKSWDLAVQSKITLQADSLLYNRYTWKPFESLITYENNSLGIAVLKAELCNISTPGKITFKNDQIGLNFTMKAVDQEVKEVLTCLEGGEKQMTGFMNLEADISGLGTKDTLANSLQGKLQYSSKDGYIYQDAKAAKLLYVLNVTNLFKDKIPDLRSTGFRYDSLVVKGVMEKGILTIAPAKLEAPIMQIAANGTINIPRERVNLMVLVAPLQTINKMQEMLPVIKKILPGGLVAVPVEITGDFSDIKVRALPISAIGSRVFDVMVDALSTPAHELESTLKK